MLTIVSILGLGAGFYVCDWSDKYQRRGAAQAELAERHRQWQKLQLSIQEFPRVQTEVQQKQQKLSQMMASSGHEFDDDFVPNYLTEVERRVDRDLSIQSITPAAPSQSADSLPTRVFTLSMRGSYATTVDFLYQLSARKSERVLTINSLRLTKGNGPLLQVDLPVTAYLRR